MQLRPKETALVKLADISTNVGGNDRLTQENWDIREIALY